MLPWMLHHFRSCARWAGTLYHSHLAKGHGVNIRTASTPVRSDPAMVTPPNLTGWSPGIFANPAATAGHVLVLLAGSARRPNLDPAEQKALTSSIQGIQRQIAVIEEAATAS
jgi:hypothetical protein